MKSIRHLFLATLALAATLACSLSPINAEAAVGYQGNYYTTPIKKTSFAAVTPTLAPASAATDVLVISGSASKTIFVDRLSCTGTATAAGSAPVFLVKRSTADSAGTSTAAVPVALDSNNLAASANILAYTANPTLGATVGAVTSGVMAFAPAAGAPASALTFTFGTTQSEKQYVTLRGASQSLALNFNGVSAPAGASLNCTVEWIEQ